MMVRVRSCFVLLLASVGLLSSTARAKDYSTSKTTQVVVLGTGTPLPDPDRRGPAVAVIVNGQPYIVDAGEGVWRGFGAAMPLYGGPIAGLNWENLSYIFLTHLHSDHTIGLPGLLLHPWSLGTSNRKVPAQVYGPPGTKELVENLLAAYRGDINERVYGYSHKNDLGWRSVGHDVSQPGLVYRDKNVRIEAFNSSHGAYPITYAYRFTTPDRVIAISGDTRLCPGVEEAAKGANILIHEVYGLKHLTEAPEGIWKGGREQVQQSVARYHTSTRELAGLARKLRPGVLVLYHQQNWSKDREANAKEIREFGYDGKVVSAEDGDVF